MPNAHLRLLYTYQLCGGRTHSLGGEGGGGSIFWKKPDIGLASYSIISLWFNKCTVYSILLMYHGSLKYVLYVHFIVQSYCWYHVCLTDVQYMFSPTAGTMSV